MKIVIEAKSKHIDRISSYYSLIFIHCYVQYVSISYFSHFKWKQHHFEMKIVHCTWGLFDIRVRIVVCMGCTNRIEKGTTKYNENYCETMENKTEKKSEVELSCIQQNVFNSHLNFIIIQILIKLHCFSSVIKMDGWKNIQIHPLWVHCDNWLVSLIALNGNYKWILVQWPPPFRIQLHSSSFIKSKVSWPTSLQIPYNEY